MPARMKANGNFRDASVEYFYSVRKNRMMHEPEWRCWPGSSCTSL